MNTSLPIFKKAVTEAKLGQSLAAQTHDLPDSGLEMTAKEMCEKVRAYLWTSELQRIEGSKNLPLYPMVWQDTEEGLVCTGEPMKLLRVNHQMKTKDGEEFINPNYGRFFFARHIEQLDSEGMPVLNDKGYPVLDMVDFQWFADSNYARSGAFAALNNVDLSVLLLTTCGVSLKPDNMWPVDMIKAL